MYYTNVTNKQKDMISSKDAVNLIKGSFRYHIWETELTITPYESDGYTSAKDKEFTIDLSKIDEEMMNKILIG